MILSYDTLPPHSRLRRENVDGMLKITAAAEAPGPLVRRAALVRSAVPAAMICAVALLVGLAVSGPTYLEHRPYLSLWASTALIGAFVVACAALFVLVWRAKYAALINTAEQALQQNTLLLASPGKLIIESSGPFGSASHVLGADLSAQNSIVGLRCGYTPGLPRLDCLQVVLQDGSSIQLLAGRDAIELSWVLNALVQALRAR